MSDVEIIEQGSLAWLALRSGKITGTRFADVLAKSKRDGKPLKARDDLVWTLAAERIQGYQPEGPSSYSLKWGSENEPLARDAYQLRTGAFVTQEAFTVHPILVFIGVSLDGLVDDDGTLEFKCPKCPEIHLQRWIDGVPEEYIAQIQGGLWVSGRKWCDFVSYDPDTAERFKLLIIRVYRDEEYIANLEKECLILENEVQLLIAKLMSKIES